MRAGPELPQRGAHITSQQPVPESKTVLQPHQGSAGTPRRARQPQRHNPFRNVTWRSDLWENWLDECTANILRGGSSLAYLDSQRCISGRDWDSGSSCLLHSLTDIPMHPDSCSQVHAQRRRSTDASPATVCMRHGTHIYIHRIHRFIHTGSCLVRQACRLMQQIIRWT